MKRRTAIRDMIVFAGGLTLLPSCVGHPEKASIALNNIDISAGQEKLLQAIASTIIPTTDTPGAGDVGSHLFVLKMLDDCYEKEVQDKFITGLDQLEKATNKRFGNSFVKCTGEQKEKILLEVEDKQGYPGEVFQFYEIMKRRTIEGYMTSKYVVVNIRHYTLIPTVPYDGYFPISKKNV
jgi:hypothetical protein